MSDNLVIENARIGFRNFSGKGGQYNIEGRRNFCVFLNFEDGTRLQDEGWNIKWAKQRDPDEDPVAYLPVAVRFDNIPPKVVTITKNGQTLIDESDVYTLDAAEIKNTQLVIRPYHWDDNGKEKIKAYLKTLYVELEEDEFAYLYQDIPNANTYKDSNKDSNEESDLPF